MPTVFDLSLIAELRSLAAVIRLLSKVVDPEVERWLIVGATARDLILHHAYGLPPGRRTVDLDIAIAVGTWRTFEAVETRPMAEGAQHARQPRHRFTLLGWTIDVLPFGGVEQDGVIVWPPDNDNAMSVVGFEEASLNAFQVTLPGGQRVLVASPPGLIILKFIAWHERHLERPLADAIDIRALLASYAGARNEDRLYEQADDLLQHFGYDNALAGAALLGRDVASIASDRTLERIRTIITETLVNETFVLPAEMGGRIEDNVALLEALLLGMSNLSLPPRGGGI